MRRVGWLWIACAVLAVLGVLAAAGRVPGQTPEPPVVTTSSGYTGNEILGSRGLDTMRGTDEENLLFAFGGDDRVEAGSGNDLIDSGNGADEIWAGDGDDRIRAFDDTKDTIWCEDGDDIVFADPTDVLYDCEELVEADDLSSPTTPDPPSGAALDDDLGAARLVRGTIELNGEPFACRGPVDLELVRVRIGRQQKGVDAISLGQNCTGRIGRIEVDTWSGDGVKVQNAGTTAHDLVIESGYVRCHDRTPGYHQDGIQVMGGKRLTFRKLSVFCGGEGVNAALFIARGGVGGQAPADIVFENGTLGPGSAQTVFIASSRRSGVRGSIVCAGRFKSVRIADDAVRAIEKANRLVDETHSTCLRG